MFQVRLKFTSQAYRITVIISYLKTTKNATKMNLPPTPKKKKQNKKTTTTTTTKKNKQKTKNKTKTQKTTNKQNTAKQNKNQQHPHHTHKKKTKQKRTTNKKKKQIPSQSKSLHGLSIIVSNHAVLRSECATQNVISYIYNHNTSK